MDAEGWLRDERRMIERGEWVSPQKREAEIVAQHITLAEYAKTWIKERNVKPRIRIGYESLWDNHIHTLGKVALVHLTPESIRTWYSGLGTEHTRRNSHAYGLLHAILATAVGDQLIPANPANLQRAMNPPTKRQPVILDVEEVAALTDAFEPERLRALVLVLAWTGLRWGEAIELERRDVAEGAKAIRVSRAVTHREGCRVAPSLRSSLRGDRRSWAGELSAVYGIPGRVPGDQQALAAVACGLSTGPCMRRTERSDGG
jgi:integrase